MGNTHEAPNREFWKPRVCFPPGDARKQRIPHTICLALSLYQHSCLLTFHITELDHFCGHLPSKPDGFFHTPRPHAAIVHRIQPGQWAKNIASSPSISPSRTNFVIIYPQKTACYSRGSAPLFRHCRRKIQLGWG